MTVPLDTIVVQLRSEAGSENKELLNELLQLTNNFINDYFGTYYAKTEPKDYFEEARITANSYGVQGVSRSFISTVEFDGVLAFNVEPVPSTDLIRDLLTNAFKGHNLEFFLKSLMSSNDPFLGNLTHAFIEVNEIPISTTGLGTENDQESSDEGIQLQQWAEIAIYVACGIVGALVLIAFFCLCRCLFGKGQVQDAGDIIKIKDIEFPSPVNDSDKVRRHDAKAGNSKARRSQKPVDRSLSPMRSIVSQDSSMFTYNPTGMSRDLATLSLGSVSNINISNTNFDLEAWQRPNIISSRAPAPFGHDISAIEQRDHLSLIEEEDESVLQTRGSQRQSKKKKISSLDKRSSASLQYSKKTYSRNLPQPYTRESSTEESFSSSSDVINDLKNLSLQIDRHRGSKNHER